MVELLPGILTQRTPAHQKDSLSLQLIHRQDLAPHCLPSKKCKPGRNFRLPNTMPPRSTRQPTPIILMLKITPNWKYATLAAVPICLAPEWIYEFSMVNKTWLCQKAANRPSLERPAHTKQTWPPKMRLTTDGHKLPLSTKKGHCHCHCHCHVAIKVSLKPNDRWTSPYETKWKLKHPSGLSHKNHCWMPSNRFSTEAGMRNKDRKYTGGLLECFW